MNFAERVQISLKIGGVLDSCQWQQMAMGSIRETHDTPQALSPCNTKLLNSTIVKGPEFAPKQTTTVRLLKF